MATDAYMYFQAYDSKAGGLNSNGYLESESQVVLEGVTSDDISGPFLSAGTGQLFEVEDYSFDIEQVLNIGSQSRGAGAGKIAFNPFSITRPIDKSSPYIYEMACSGTPFKAVGLGLRKGSGGTTAGQFFLSFTFKLVAVKTIAWSHDETSPKETITFEYGGLQVRYGIQNPNGTIQSPALVGGWNRVNNKQDRDAKSVIQ
ncbi:MAG TPA: type VI secretion system tube protein Hcp [Rhodopila sp.]|uniref:type VI secretion system tube protein Hcp n=1 Tax=Rhodopila sp. TaxID=2480087 RepID=UPI002CA36A7B|nr:type VI secretion system tube protein Hcp [Rhodopila sp.]HVY16864.1 type VI secretion system tube protein Hcp [Rhodopila sp.]